MKNIQNHKALEPVVMHMIKWNLIEINVIYLRLLF